MNRSLLLWTALLLPSLLLTLLLPAPATARRDGAAPPAAGPPDGAAILARYEQLPACRIRIKAGLAMWGENQKTEATITFRRPGSLRIDWDGFGQAVRFVRAPGEHRVFYPQEQTFNDIKGPARTSLVWDGFANPARSLAALLEPGRRDRAILTRRWAPGLKYTGTEVEAGNRWFRYRGRGANGMAMELWVSPEDRLIHRVLLRNPRFPDMASEIRIETDLGGAPPPDAAFHLAVPKQARNMAEQDGPREMAEEMANPLAPLRRRVAERPGDPAALRALIEGLAQTGAHAEALRLALEMLRDHPTSECYELLTRTYLMMGAQQAAVSTFLKAVSRFGKTVHVPAGQGDDLGALVAAAVSSGRAGDLAKALEPLVAGNAEANSVRLLLVQLYESARAYPKAVEQCVAILDPGPPGKPPRQDLADEQAVGQTVMRMAEMAPRLEAGDRKRLAEALRKIEPRLPDEIAMALIPTYLALGDMESAQRHAERLSEMAEWGNYLIMAQMAESYASRGARPEAERLFRQALAAAVENEPWQNQAIFQLLQMEHAQAILAPVFQRLAETERAGQPLQAAHWLFFSGDFAAAARAYQDYLASPAASIENASTLDRVVASALAARSARQAKDGALADRIILGAVEDVLSLQADMPHGYSMQPYLQALLGAASSPSVRQNFMEKVADADPDGFVDWLQYGGMAMGERFGRGGPSPEIQALLKRLAALPNPPGDPEVFTQVLQNQGLTKEAAGVYSRFASQFPTQIDPQLLVGLAVSLDSGSGGGGAPQADVDEDRPAAGLPQRAIPLRAAVVAQPAVPTSSPAAATAPAEASAKPTPDPVAANLIQALATAVRQRKAWDDGESALAQWYSGHDQAAKALPLLDGIARRKGTADAYQQLAEAELAVKRTAAGLQHLQKATQLKPDDFQVQSRYGAALDAAGKRPAALELWRQLKARARTLEQVRAVVNSLQSLGRQAEAIAFLEERYPALQQSQRYMGEGDDLRSQLVQHYLGKGQKERALALYPEMTVFDLDVEPDALRHLRVNLPAEFWKLLLDRLDRANHSAAAFGAYCMALSEGGVSRDDKGVQGLIERARRLNNLGAARDALREMAGGEPTDPLWGASLAAVEEEMGDLAGAARQYRRILHPDAAVFPHYGPGVARAARQYADLLQRHPQPGVSADEPPRCRKWAEAYALLEKLSDDGAAADAPDRIRKAQALFPESPCIQVALVQQLKPEELKDGAAALEALRRMLPVCAHARQCPLCGQFLGRQASPGVPALPLDRLLSETHESGAALYLAAIAQTSQSDPFDPSRAPLWRKVVDRDPSIIPAWEALRELSNRQNDMEHYVEAAEKVAAGREDNAQDWLQLAQAYMRTNRRADARKAIEKAHDLDARVDPAAYGLEPRGMQALWMRGFFDSGDNELMMLFNGSEYYGLMNGFEPW